MLLEWIITLFDSSGFVPCGQRGPWSVSLQLTLLVISLRRQSPFCRGWTLPCLAASAAACGVSRICDLMAFWWSAYRFYALVDAVTAILTVASALALFYFVPIFGQPCSFVLSSSDHENISRALALKDREISDLHETVGMLCKQMDSLERIQRSGQWFADQQRLLEQVRSKNSHNPT